MIDANEGPTGEDMTEFTSVDHTADPAFFLRFLDAVNTLPGALAWKPAILDGLRIQHGANVLDVGCGAGFDALELANRVGPEGRVTGVDTSSSLIEEARRRVPGEGLPVAFGTGDAQALRFLSDKFDAIRAEQLLMHVPDPERALSEMARVLRRGGRIAVHDFDWETQICDSPYKEVMRKIALSVCDTLKHGWIGRRLPRLFVEVGLTEVSTCFQTITVPFTFLQLLLGGHVAGAVAKGVLAADEADHWWTHLALPGHFRKEASVVICGVTDLVGGGDGGWR